ncbi:GumC family protein [Flavobacterium aquiphilum]|uniref:GumC family protein n=1 Tax=Flavobacterium aquiphilum TaxID=3003261 RepID=UPI00248011E5|nr:tyrosine-protein kinase family protein [Flavobacterium aquiphilum]
MYNTDRNDFFDNMDDNNGVPFQEVIRKYLRYWPWFLVTVVVSIFMAFIYLRYTDVIYRTEAKIKLLNDKENSNFTLDVSKLFNKSSINLENEVALLKSVHLSEKVVKNLQLNVEYFHNSAVTSKRVYNQPFKVFYTGNPTLLKNTLEYTITVTRSGYTIQEVKSGRVHKNIGYFMLSSVQGFPIMIKPYVLQRMAANIDKNFTVNIRPINQSAMSLSNAFQINPEGTESDILSISLDGTDGSQSEAIINNLIKVFGEDGISDKQEVSRRTISFVEDRFVYLRRELDSIESSKKEYKKKNNLSFIQEDAEASIQSKMDKEQILDDVESQMLLAQLLKQNIENQKVFELLPANIGIQNITINQLVDEYNKTVLEFQKNRSSAGSNNPSLKVLISELSIERQNIINSVKAYKQQLQTKLVQSKTSQREASISFSSLPEKEKVLRSIERQQNLKESLYLLLLQKKEEAAINLAVTIPNTKIIDYAITKNYPIYPKKSTVFIAAILIGLLFPFGILFLVFKLDNKIYNAVDIESYTASIPILAEIPSSENSKSRELQSVEAFRTLANNTNFITPFDSQNRGSVIFVTSSIKGEGKTYVSYNLADAYAHLDKKVILVGADFRNPQLHRHLNQSREGGKGFSNYLHDLNLQWRDLIFRADDRTYSFDILLSGDIPPNPTLLLSSHRFASFIDELKQQYDIVIFDTPPTLIVTDSLIISKYADTTLYLVRSGVTEKRLVTYSKKLSDEKKIVNMGYVINAIDLNRFYSYGYNYGYGYGYGKDMERKSWYKRLFQYWM